MSNSRMARSSLFSTCLTNGTRRRTLSKIGEGVREIGVRLRDGGVRIGRSREIGDRMIGELGFKFAVTLDIRWRGIKLGCKSLLLLEVGK